MPGMVYRWKGHVQIPVSAQAVGERLEALVSERGRLTPAIVVEDARHPESALHPCFEWDDAVAARLHRENQARYLLRSIVVDLPRSCDAEPCQVRAFVSVEPEGEERSYQPIMVVMARPDLRKQLLERALLELWSWRERYHEFDELAAIFEAMDQTSRRLIAV